MDEMQDSICMFPDCQMETIDGDFWDSLGEIKDSKYDSTYNFWEEADKIVHFKENGYYPEDDFNYILRLLDEREDRYYEKLLSSIWRKKKIKYLIKVCKDIIHKMDYDAMTSLSNKQVMIEQIKALSNDSNISQAICKLVNNEPETLFTMLASLNSMNKQQQGELREIIIELRSYYKEQKKLNNTCDC